MVKSIESKEVFEGETGLCIKDMAVALTQNVIALLPDCTCVCHFVGRLGLHASLRQHVSVAQKS